MAMRSRHQSSTSSNKVNPWRPRIPTQFLLAVSRNPPSKAQPNPKNISCICQCNVLIKGLNAGVGLASVPL